MLTSPELISVTAETSHPQPRKLLSMAGGRAGGGGGLGVQMTREKEEKKQRGPGRSGEEGGGGGGGCKSVWVKMHPQHICKSLAVGYRGGGGG
uniref:Uncharacterized protein n=1 Tax=Knipowitschia caucasica TaxID=637954 RepID=A0AAV2LIT2_KNICA